MRLTAQEYKPGLGKREASLLAALAGRDKTLFTTGEAKAVVGPSARRIIRGLVRKKWVLPLKRGLYCIVPLDVGLKGADALVVHNFVIASLLVKPYYVGFWSALNHHGLTDQIPRTTFVATTKARHAVRALDSEYYFVRLTRKKFFGWQEVELETRKIRISGPEKTIADCLDHPEHCGGIEQVARAIYFSHADVDLARVVKHAKRMGNNAILKRLGHILEVTGLLPRFGPLFARFKPSAGFPKLDTLSPRIGKHDGRWNLLVNYRLDPEEWQY